MTDQTPQGGSYRSVRKANEGGEVHHIPAYGAYSKSGILSKDDGPSLWMTTEDHSKTASWRNSKEAKDYRKKQKELIDQGKFSEAQQMDVEDIQSKFGNKYDLGLQEAQNYTNENIDPHQFTTEDNPIVPSETKAQLKGDYTKQADSQPRSETIEPDKV